jgi:uncharacterized protein (DUF302 family)
VTIAEEWNMKPDADLVTLRSAHSANETVERLNSFLDQKKIQIFAHIDHAAAAKNAGLSLRPTEALILGNPRAGTPLMQSQQTIGRDLPLRVPVWEDEADTVWLTYRPLKVLALEHHLAGRDEAVKALDDGLSALARAATSRSHRFLERFIRLDGNPRQLFGGPQTGAHATVRARE